MYGGENTCLLAKEHFLWPITTHNYLMGENTCLLSLKDITFGAITTSTTSMAEHTCPLKSKDITLGAISTLWPNIHVHSPKEHFLWMKGHVLLAKSYFFWWRDIPLHKRCVSWWFWAKNKVSWHKASSICYLCTIELLWAPTKHHELRSSSKNWPWAGVSCFQLK